MKLIMECRQSGLSDYQWCQRQDINVDTFYNWVSKPRKAGYTIPDSKSKSEGAVVVQDVVKVNLVSEDMSSSVTEQNTRPIAAASPPSVAAELVVENVTLRLFNGADQNLIRCAIYLFCGKRCDRIKVLLRGPYGYVLLYKRLDVVHGKYRWPRNSSEVKPVKWDFLHCLMKIKSVLYVERR